MPAAFCLRDPLELVGEKNDVSTFSLDFLLCGIALDSSSWMVSTMSVLFTGWPRDSRCCLSRREPGESKCVTDLEDSESTDGLLPLEEREDLLDGMMGNAEPSLHRSGRMKVGKRKRVSDKLS